MNLRLEPAKDHVALQILDTGEQTTDGGIILTEEKNAIISAKVIAVNPDETWLKEDDVVYLRKAQLHDFVLEFGEVKLALASAIVAKIVESKK